jgi:predicted nucleotidyltransferase
LTQKPAVLRRRSKPPTWGGVVGAVSRVETVDAVIQRVSAWVASRADIRGLALVGSYAKGNPTQDSDVDLIVLTNRPPDYIGRDDWITELGAGEPVKTETWGAITERRLRQVDGLEVEIGFGEPSWASTKPVDAGTRRVVLDGIRILHDPDLLLSRLVETVLSSSA